MLAVRLRVDTHSQDAWSARCLNMLQSRDRRRVAIASRSTRQSGNFPVQVRHDGFPAGNEPLQFNAPSDSPHAYGHYKRRCICAAGLVVFSLLLSLR
jgi:hypothetical protein